MALTAYSPYYYQARDQREMAKKALEIAIEAEAEGNTKRQRFYEEMAVRCERVARGIEEVGLEAYCRPTEKTAAAFARRREQRLG